jgi:hypothetical protein
MSSEHLYTILLHFGDCSIGIEQIWSKDSSSALKSFLERAECLQDFDRDKILNIVNSREDVLYQFASGMKGLWGINFGLELLDDSLPEKILGGKIVQTDPDAPYRN